MALSKHQSKKEKALPIFQEGERVLTFHGSSLREAVCVRMAIEDRRVKYLVRYKSEGVMGMGMGLSRVSPGAAAYPDTLPGPSSGSSTSAGPESSSGGASSSVCPEGPSTSSAAIPSTSYAIPGPSSVGPSAGPSTSEHLGTLAGWDYEWIPESRVLRYSSPSGKDSDGDDGSADDSSTASSGGCGQASDMGEGGSHGDGEGAEASVAQLPLSRLGLGPTKKIYVKKREVKVTLPDGLKPLLVKDWELVNHGKKLFKLPAKRSVDAILAEYAVIQQNCVVLSKRYAVQDLVAGIKEYFNVMLGTQLLYQFERPQYTEILACHPNVHMSQIYGGAHLLRLFVQIGSMLAYTSLDDSSLTLLLGHMHDFLKYLACNPSAVFTVADYQAASAEYQQRAQ
ncbi:mortality factor 4-like protein 1 [Trichosurus vulpecula]|uniref:mortality factor 4-like protein 1 n=1 Tax=Trichosurus vulpecula TaxID=9337 RepID=UPI00186B2728|nr:mortality factor 4-like protein 1 [Trichosurus vulpecula]